MTQRLGGSLALPKASKLQKQPVFSAKNRSPRWIWSVILRYHVSFRSVKKKDLLELSIDGFFTSKSRIQSCHPGVLRAMKNARISRFIQIGVHSHPAGDWITFHRHDVRRGPSSTVFVCLERRTLGIQKQTEDFQRSYRERCSTSFRSDRPKSSETG